MKIGNVILENDIFLAPMAGITDMSFRIICRKMGAGLVFTEMVSSRGLYHEDDATNEITRIDQRERPVALQIFGSEPHVLSKVVYEQLNKREDIDIIDFNMGCPAPKVVKNGDGSALLKDPSLIKNILNEIVNVSNKPVTVKIRMGWDSSSINAVEIAKIAESAGVSAITVHGRTRDMFYTGKADWNIIKDVKKNVGIPVIGNGDIFEPEDALKMFKHTGCDAVAIGRAARGNPWIFKRTLALLSGKTCKIPTEEEVINTAIEHLEMLCDLKGERRAVKEMRKHIAWYLKGLKNSTTIKNKVNRITEKEEMKNELLNYLEELKKNDSLNSCSNTGK